MDAPYYAPSLALSTFAISDLAMSRHASYSSLPSDSQFAKLYSCPIARIEAERKLSPMALLVRHTTRTPTFA